MEHEAVSREHEWAAAGLKKDLKTLEGLLGAEFTLTTAAGEMSRAAWMQHVSLWSHKAWEVKNIRAQAYGDVALVTGRLHWHVIKDKPDPRTGSKDVDQDFTISDLWVRRDGRWQVVARHSTIALS